MKKDLLIIGFVLLLAVLLCRGVRIQSVEDYYLTHADDITPDSQTVTLSISCASILEHWENLDEELRKGGYVPEDGVLLEKKQYVLRPEDTVFSILVRAAKNEQIPIEYQGSQENAYGSAYIQGIQYIYEFSCGPLSGWMYRVNGEFPKKGCSQYVLKDGDEIEWIYTCDLGRDIGTDLSFQKGQDSPSDQGR